jgi:ribose/xylose/arabinose/galactoside ABC-type transport system permease subunit
MGIASTLTKRCSMKTTKRFFLLWVAVLACSTVISITSDPDFSDFKNIKSLAAVSIFLGIVVAGFIYFERAKGKLIGRILKSLFIVAVTAFFFGLLFNSWNEPHRLLWVSVSQALVCAIFTLVAIAIGSVVKFGIDTVLESQDWTTYQTATSFLHVVE